MKKLITLAILLLVAMPLALAKQSRAQDDMDEKVEGYLQTPSDYEKLITTSNNKVETVCNMIGIEYKEDFNSEMKRVFRALYHSTAFKRYLSLHSGVKYYGVNRS